VIILDTDVLSIIQRADGQDYEKLARRLDSVDDDVAVSIISFEEQMRGWLAFIARGRSSHDAETGPLKTTHRNNGSKNCGYRDRTQCPASLEESDGLPESSRSQG
jgi:hypothetical protein